MEERVILFRLHHHVIMLSTPPYQFITQFQQLRNPYPCELYIYMCMENFTHLLYLFIAIQYDTDQC